MTHEEMKKTLIRKRRRAMSKKMALEPIFFSSFSVHLKLHVIRFSDDGDVFILSMRFSFLFLSPELMASVFCHTPEKDLSRVNDEFYNTARHSLFLKDLETLILLVHEHRLINRTNFLQRT